jgi:ADP-ribose pyrophosphatase YjhB (NUDIX family)
MRFCPECASPVTLIIPAGDTRLRHVCTKCNIIHYENPKVVVGTIPVWERDGELQVLLCKRAIEPRYGFWTLPGGFMENGESTDEAAVRETIEEAGAHILLQGLFTLLNVPHVNQVHMFYRATLLNLGFMAGDESLEVKLFSEADIPWPELAFDTIGKTLEYFFADHAKVADGGQYSVHAHTCIHRTIYTQPAR